MCASGYWISEISVHHSTSFSCVTVFGKNRKEKNTHRLIQHPAYAPPFTFCCLIRVEPQSHAHQFKSSLAVSRCPASPITPHNYSVDRGNLLLHSSHATNLQTEVNRIIYLPAIAPISHVVQGPLRQMLRWNASHVYNEIVAIHLNVLVVLGKNGEDRSGSYLFLHAEQLAVFPSRSW